MNTDRSADAPENEKDKPSHRSNGDSSTKNVDAHSNRSNTSEHDTLSQLLLQYQEWREYLSYYLTAQTDRLKLVIRHTSLWIVLAVMACVATGSIIVTANWYLLSGTAEGLGILFGGRTWAGKMFAGLLWLVVPGLGIWIIVARRNATSREKTIRKYEQRQAEQKAEYGRNVNHQAAAGNSDQE